MASNKTASILLKYKFKLLIFKYIIIIKNKKYLNFILLLSSIQGFNRNIHT